MAVKNRKFSVNIPNVSNQWIHLVLNFIDPNSGEGIQAFKDGAFIAENQGGADGNNTVGDGRVIVGKKHANSNKFYAHVEVDELIFFNEALSNEEVGQYYVLVKMYNGLVSFHFKEFFFFKNRNFVTAKKML